MSRRKKSSKSFDNSVNTHHLLYYRRNYQKSSANALRRHWYCVVPIRKDLHQEIHALTDGVPIPRKLSVEGILFQLDLLEKYGGIHPYDPIEKRLQVLIALTECSEQPTCDALKKQLEIVDRFNKPS